ncbi:MAG TPA: hypothetical protein DCQ04_05570 [Actinobacteria bacterium]|nr:hypothetical protein [Actinomycetota bacterium]
MKILSILLLAPLVALAGWPPPTQDQAQRIFDGFVDSADELIAEAVGFSQAPEPAAHNIRIWSTSAESDIRALKGYFRLTIPPPKVEMIDGKEELLYEGFKCGCYGDFVITLKKDGREIASFRMAHGEHIGCRAIRDDSAIRIDKVALAPFNSRLIELARKMFAEKRAEERKPAGEQATTGNDGKASRSSAEPEVRRP